MKIFLALISVLLAGCTVVNNQAIETSPAPIPTAAQASPTSEPTMSALPNPASVYCEQQGYQLEIRTAADGSQSGVCIFPDGSECDEWAYYRGECQSTVSPIPTASDQLDSNGWKIYTNTDLGYSFHYPAEATITINDNPKAGLFIYGAGMGAETWTISHPSNRSDYHPPDGMDLFQWLADHYLIGENRQPDVQIADTTAIHFRHNQSPQSTAFDTYYFAHSSRLYEVIIGHSGDSEDWELSNLFLQSFQFDIPIQTYPPTPIPTALPIDPAAYQDWITYTHPTIGFTLRLPDGWVVEEASAGDPLLIDHLINIYSLTASLPQNIRLTFRQVGEDTLLWPTGVGEGEFISQGTLDIAGEPAERLLLVCPTGEVTAIWYHQSDSQPNIVRGNLEFGIIYSTYGHCEPGYSLDGETQLLGELIISSLSVP